MLQLVKDRNFLTFWVGEFVSVVGDHISIVAFPLLVLQMTESVALTGMVFAAQGLPRAILMLVGGAIVDRHSPRFVMLLSNMARFILVMIVAWLIHKNQATIEVIIVTALAFGIVDAFFYPASIAMVPSLVEKERLQKANALVQGSVFVGVIFGPALAGLIIAGEATTMGHEMGDAASYASNREGFARAFFFDGLTFAASFITLMFVRSRSLGKSEAGAEGKKSSMLSEIGEALRWVWAEPTIRLGFIGIAILEFFYQASIFVGLPALAKARFLEPAYIFGLLVTSYGGGALIGSLAGGGLKPIPERYLIRVMFLVFMATGASLGLIVLYEPYWWAMLVFFVVGACDSYVMVNFTTWIQKKTPDALLGRVMSIFMFLAVGLVPVAAALQGLAFEWNLELSMLIISGIIMVSCLIAALHPDAVYTGQKSPEDETFTDSTIG